MKIHAFKYLMLTIQSNRQERWKRESRQGRVGRDDHWSMGVIRKCQDLRGGTSKGQFRLSSLETVRDGLEICRWGIVDILEKKVLNMDLWGRRKIEATDVVHGCSKGVHAGILGMVWAQGRWSTVVSLKFEEWGVECYQRHCSGLETLGD